MPAEKCINRNILECKADLGQEMDTEQLSVLIETYWNVKCSRYAMSGSSAPVLIETYWNVKDLRGHTKNDPGSINRNILECKVYSFGCQVLSQ